MRIAELLYDFNDCTDVRRRKRKTKDNGRRKKLKRHWERKPPASDYDEAIFRRFRVALKTAAENLVSVIFSLQQSKIDRGVADAFI